MLASPAQKLTRLKTVSLSAEVSRAGQLSKHNGCLKFKLAIGGDRTANYTDLADAEDASVAAMLPRNSAFTCSASNGWSSANKHTHWSFSN